ACASTWAAEWRMTLRPSSVSAPTASTSTSASGVQDRSRSAPSESRTTTIVSGPLVGRPASRTAAPAVVPAGTRTIVAGFADAGVVTVTDSSARCLIRGRRRARAAVDDREHTATSSCYRHPRGPRTQGAAKSSEVVETRQYPFEQFDVRSHLVGRAVHGDL